MIEPLHQNNSNGLPPEHSSEDEALKPRSSFESTPEIQHDGDVIDDGNVVASEERNRPENNSLNSEVDNRDDDYAHHLEDIAAEVPAQNTTFLGPETILQNTSETYIQQAVEAADPLDLAFQQMPDTYIPPETTTADHSVKVPEAEDPIQQSSSQNEHTEIDRDQMEVQSYAFNNNDVPAELDIEKRLDLQDRQPHLVNPKQIRTKAVTFALAVGMLPVLIAGTATYFVGQAVIQEQVLQLEEETSLDASEITRQQRRHLDLLAILSLGTGITAILTGSIAAFSANRAVRVAMKRAADTAKQNLQQSQSQQSQDLTAAIEQIRASLSPAEIREIAVHRIKEMLCCDRVIIYGIDEHLERRVVAESVNLGIPSMMDSTVSDPLFVAKYMEPYEREVRVIEDIEQVGDNPKDLQQFKDYHIQAMMTVPLTVFGERMGFVVAHDCSNTRMWTIAEIDLFHQLTTQVGFALDLAQTNADRNELKQTVALESQWRGTFQETSQLLHETLAAEDILEAAVIETRRVLACDRVLVYSLNQDNKGVIIAESAVPGCSRAFGKTIIDPCFDAKYIDMYADGRVRATPDIYKADLLPCYIEQLEMLDVKANLVAPIIHEGKLMGLLVAHQCSETRVWKDLEIRWYQQIAIQVGYALDNAKFKQQAEHQAQMFYQEQAGVQNAIVTLLRESKATSETLSTKSADHLESINAVVDQLQAIADSSRQIAAKAEKTEQARQSVSESLQAGHTSVNQAVDVMTEIQDTVIESASKVGDLSITAQSIAQIMGLINEAVEPMSQLAISLSIASGRSREQDQGAIVDATESVLAFAQKITAATHQLQPLVQQMELDFQTVVGAMEIETEQIIMGTELAKQTRHHLNQITTYEDKLTTLLEKLVTVVPSQTQTLTTASQSIQAVLALTHQTIEKSAELSNLIQTLETSIQQS